MINPVILLMRWLQIIPIALLMISPFKDLKLWLGERYRRFITVSFTILGCAALGALGIASVARGWNWDLCLAALLAIYFSGWLCAVHTSTAHKLLAGGVMLHYAAMLNAVGNIFVAFAQDGNYLASIKESNGFPVFCLCFLAANAFFWLLTWYFLRRVLRENLPVLEEQDAKQGLWGLCIMFVLFCVAAYNPNYDLKVRAPLIVAALVVTNMIACIMFFRGTGMARKQAKAEGALAVCETQYRQFNRTMEETHRLRLTMRRRLNELSELNAQGKQDEITEYLKQYETAGDRLEEQESSGDPVVDNVLKYYLSRAWEEGIPVECQTCLDGLSGMSAADLTVLLGNCLEEAMTALRTLPPKTRRLFIEITSVDAMLVVRIESSCGNPAGRRDFASMQAFPANKAQRSEGLRSASLIAEKHRGIARFEQMDKAFIALVVLCISTAAD